MRRIAGGAFVSVAGLLCLIVAAAPADVLQVYRIGPMDRVGPAGSVTDAGPIMLYAAKGEAEAFQIVVAARGGSLSGVDVIASNLTGSGGVIKSDNIKLFRELYIWVGKNNLRAPLGTGFYPDALVPFRNPYTGADPEGVKYDATPFDVASGKNQPIWVEVSVPTGAKAGTYKGSLTIKTDSGKQSVVTYKLRVWNFTLPKVPSLQSFFGIWEFDKYYKLKWGTQRWFLFQRRYTDFLIDHRLAHEYPQELDFGVNKDGDIIFEKNFLGYKSTAEIFDYYMKERGMSAIVLPIDERDPIKDPLGANRSRAIAFLRNFLDFAKEGGWADRLYVYTIDEPESAKAYEKVRQWGKLIDEASKELRFLVTEQPRPDKAAWGSLIGVVDLWVPMPLMITRKEAEERLAAGEELWTYTALVQDKYSPKWLIDYYPIEYRVLVWLAASYGMTGLEYWETTWWWNTSDPWVNISVYKDGAMRFPSEGQLLYPGTLDTVGYEGPVPSMRFKWVRDGFEDYEYIKKLRDLGKAKFVDRLLSKSVKSVKSWTEWTRSPALLDKQKRRMGRRIEKLVGK